MSVFKSYAPVYNSQSLSRFTLFLLRKMMLSTSSLDSLFRNLFRRSPAALKILSEGTDVAGTARMRLATVATWGNRCSFFRHQLRGSASGSIFSARYSWSSSFADWFGLSYSRKSSFSRLAGLSWSGRGSDGFSGRSSRRDSSWSSTVLR